MSDIGKMKLSDDMLEEITGGAQTQSYDPKKMKQAGVIISTTGGKTSYYAMIKGKKTEISANVAKGMCDCYDIGGGTKLSDQQITALIQQS